MPRRKQTKKSIVKKTKTILAGTAQRKDMRFKLSLVILIGMLTFSSLLLIVSLNRSDVANAETKKYPVRQIMLASVQNGQKSRVLDDSALDFKLSIPVQLGEWLYKTGEVQSLTDTSLSNEYLRIFVPFSGIKSSNFDEQNKEVLTIRKFGTDDWDDIMKSCKKEEKEICDAAGKEIMKTGESNGDSWVYAYTKPTDCPQSIKGKCALADKIIESFELK